MRGLGNEQRLCKHASIKNDLNALTDQDIEALLTNAEPIASTMARTCKITIGSTPVFVKKIPLTAIEHNRSTANVFDLPTYYQYGIGSAGFGAWRELDAHVTTTDWVLSGKCPNFPIMYHWRVLANDPAAITEEAQNTMDQMVKHWGGSPAIRARLEALHLAPESIVLFLEYIPQTASAWLDSQLKPNKENALTMVDHDLTSTTAFMHEHDFIHFDAHFGNILTDGNQLYFTDFGLAMSLNFDLSQAELEFFHQHSNYDRCSTILHYVYNTHVAMYSEDNWDQALEDYATGTKPFPTPIPSGYIEITAALDQFYKSLQINKSTPYPQTQLQHLLNNPCKLGT